MADSRLELLPNEVKLHVFSFLARRDLTSLFCVSRTFRCVDSDPGFWQARIRMEFFLHRDMHANLKDEHRNLLEQQERELRLLTAYIHAAHNIISLYEEQEDIEMAYKEIEHALERYNVQGFLTSIQNKYGIVTPNPVIFQRFLAQSSDLLKESSYSVQQVISREYIESPHFVLTTLVKCNATLLLNIFFKNLSWQNRDLILQRVGADLLCHAASMGHVETVDMLLMHDVNPNRYSVLHQEMGFPLHVLPIHMLFILLSKKNRAITKGKQISQLINMLLDRGADMDLPGVYHDFSNDLLTMRQKATNILAALRQRHDDHSYRGLLALVALLSQIKAAPVLSGNSESMFLK